MIAYQSRLGIDIRKGKKMEMALFLIMGSMLALGFMILGAMLNERRYKKCAGFLIKYRRLSPKSKDMVNNYLVAREAYDDRTTLKKV